MTRNRLNLITAGVMLSMFLASMEGTVVATAMPTIVGQLGGLSIYSWVFSIYQLASTTTVPIYGKLSDLYGRKWVYAISMLLFLAGSVLCSLAQTMEQLILFRSIQGLGAGGVLPLAFTIIGEIFDLEQRTRMQGLFSGVWGVSAVIGPLIGGFLVDQVSWHWVFLINLLPGAAALGLVWFAWQETIQPRKDGVAVDYLGAALLTLAALSLLLGLNEQGSPYAPWLLAAAVLLIGALFWAERRAADPMLPLHLFRDRLFTVTIIQGLLAGWAMFGSLNYVPLFVQAVLATSATEAGITLTPMSLCWTLASVLAGRLLLTSSYKTMALVGMVFVTFGAVMMALVNPHTSQWLVMLWMGVMGTGMGLSVPAFLIAVQSLVDRRDLGVATSTIQFSRSIGGTIGVSVLGVVLSSQLASQLTQRGLDPSLISIDSLLNNVGSAASSANLGGPLREALAVSIASLFIIASIVAVLGLVSVFFAPQGKISEMMKEKSPPPVEMG